MPLVVPGLVSPASAAPDSDAAGKTLTYHCTEKTEVVSVPEGIDMMAVHAAGAQGGTHSGGHGGKGGYGGEVTARVAVDPGDTIRLGVGCEGHADGGWGGAGAHGGDHGYAFDSGGGYSGPGGGGASTVSLANELKVIAGGGGGGGGYGTKHDHSAQGARHNSRGGDGGHPAAAGKKGYNTYSGRSASPGCGGCEDGRAGHDGAKSHHGGGGGGGGGGYRGGGGAEGGNEGEHGGGDGGGGGGGSSWASEDTIDPEFLDIGRVGDGYVKLTWLQVTPASVKVYGGADQDTPAGAEFTDPLQVKVITEDGYAVEGAEVTFDVSGQGSDGPGGVFTDEDGGSGDTSASVDTGADGIATSPVIVADDHIGEWEATASVDGVDDPATLTLTNEKASSSTSGSVETDSPVAGGDVSFSAVVAAADVGGTPTGNVKFSFEEDGPTKTMELIDGKASWTYRPDTSDRQSWAHAGGHTMYIDYSGDGYFAIDQAAIPFTIGKIPTDVTVSSEPNPSVVNDPASVTAKVTAADDAPVPVGNEVEFRIDDGTVVTAQVDDDGTASVELPDDLKAGKHTVTAALAGDDWYAASTGSMTQQVGADATAVDVSTSPEPSQYGEQVTYSAIVTPGHAGARAPTGQVTFSTGETVLCTAELTNDGAAQCSVAAKLDPGDHTITALFVTDNDDFADGVGQAVHTVAKHATSVASVSVDPEGTVTGQSATMSATVDWNGVDPAADAGMVQFLVDDAKIGDPVTGAGDGTVTAPWPADVGVGGHTVTAEYLGNDDFAPSVGRVGHKVAAADTGTGVTVSPAPSDPGQAVKFTATVAPVDPGAGVLSGTVQFRVDGEDSGDPAAVNGQGVAVSAPVDSLGPGSHDVVAVFEADTRDYAGSSDSASHRVTEKTITTMRSSRNPSVYEEELTFTAKVLPAESGYPVAAGTVDFTLAGE